MSQKTCEPRVSHWDLLSQWSGGHLYEVTRGVHLRNATLDASLAYYY